MEKRILGVFYCLILGHHLYASKFVHEIDYGSSPDIRVSEVKQFLPRYFTGWNMAVQLIYAIVVIITAIMSHLPKKLQKYEDTILATKGYLFNAFLFPMAFFVAGMFWIIFYVNREWVLPATADKVIPSWINHSIHTAILLPVIVETIVAKQHMPSFKSAFLGLSILTITYNLIFFYTYYECGRWLYGIFYVLNWFERIGFMFVNYIICFLLMKLGFGVQYLKRRRSSLTSLLKLSKSM